MEEVSVKGNICQTTPLETTPLRTPDCFLGDFLCFSSLGDDVVVFLCVFPFIFPRILKETGEPLLCGGFFALYPKTQGLERQGGMAGFTLESLEIPECESTPLEMTPLP